MTIKDRKKRIQRTLKDRGFSWIVVDGDLGIQSVGALEEVLGIGGMGAGILKKPSPSVVPPESSLDERSEATLATLLPPVRSAFRRLGRIAKTIAAGYGADFKWIGGTRTYEEQNALYAKGRTTAGRKVTNARGGYSNHNFGIAADGGLFDGNAYLDSDDPARASRIYAEIAKEARKLDIEWGGDWKSFRDEPHFQFDNGLSTAQMRARVKAGKAVV